MNDDDDNNNDNDITKERIEHSLIGKENTIIFNLSKSTFPK